ncbi:MAG: DUF3306 domain-containing protein, partial [Burkholderiales bacterium]
FMHAKVDESVKRAALKKLFSDPRFNVMDGLDTYIDDYTRNEGVSEEMLKTLEHAKSTLFGPQPAKDDKPEPKPQAEPAQARKDDDDTRQDA